VQAPAAEAPLQRRPQRGRAPRAPALPAVGQRGGPVRELTLLEGKWSHRMGVCGDMSWWRRRGEDEVAMAVFALKRSARTTFLKHGRAL
jgi:hypothetical protein